MRIALADTTISGELIGGAQTFLVCLVNGVVAKGHEVHLVAGGVPNKRVSDTLGGTGVLIHADLWPAGSLIHDAAPVVAGWVNDLRPDVFVVSVSPDIGWTVLPHIEPRIATLTIGHNDQETFYAPVRHYSQFLTRAVGVSEEICRKYRDECGMAAERVEWIPYGVEVMDREPAEHGDGPLRLLYVGRLDEVQKRISDVIKITKQLGETNVDFTLDIVGDGDEMPVVKRELLNEIADGKVRLHGWLASEHVIERMRTSDVFVLASSFEGFCISLTEAMANGCCPVVTDIRSGNKQLVDEGKSGFVVPVGDIDAFVDRIKLLATDRERLIEMRRSAWETGRQYSGERMVDNYVACFERAIDDARANPRKPDPDFPLMPSCRSKYPLWLRRIKARFSATN